MAEKINRKDSSQFLIIALLFLLLIFTRFVNIGWGLPYPMHPDERNMAIAILNLNFKDFFNPHFYAYGQLPLYLGYLLTVIYKFLTGNLGTSAGFVEATLALRILSATASIANVFVLYRIISKLKAQNFIAILILTFVPYAVQFAHFGTTESLLMLFYSLIIYYSFLLINAQISTKKFLLSNVLICGLAIATKISAYIFLTIPIAAYALKTEHILRRKQKSKLQITIKNFLIFSIIFTFSSFFLALVFSPHNLIHWKEFFSTIKYESAVAMGNIEVFYTRQFANTVPVWFQFTKIFPYSLGLPLFIMFCLGFIFLSWKEKKINFLRFTFLIYFFPNAFLYAKWTRFMAPVFPVMMIFSILMILKIKNKITLLFLIFISILPGLFYLHIYLQPDVRFQASDWIYKNVPENSIILSETANVVDIPLPVANYKTNQVYQPINFNFYDLDENPKLQDELTHFLGKADYIIVPSRRIFMNHTCKNFHFSFFNFQSIFDNRCKKLRYKYPQLNDYYDKLFSGKLGFREVAEFTTVIFPDEQAEETFSVFDHPVIRIYNKK